MGFGGILSWLLSPIGWALFGIGWALSVTLPFTVLHVIFSVIDLLGFGFINKIFFKDVNNLSDLFNFGNSNGWIFLTMLALIIFIIATFSLVIKQTFSDAYGENNVWKIWLKKSWIIIFIIFGLPLALVLSLNVLQLILNTFIRSVGGGGNSNIATSIFISSYSPSYGGTGLKEQWIASSESSRWYTDAIYWHFNVGSSAKAWLLTSVIGISAVYFTLKIVFQIAIETFRLVAMLFVSGIPAAMAVNDGGTRFKAWRSSVASSIFTIFFLKGGLAIWALWIAIVGQVLQSDNDASDLAFVDPDGWIKFFTKMFLVIGAGFGIKILMLDFHKYITGGSGASHANESAGVAQEATRTSMMAGGLLAGGAGAALSKIAPEMVSKDAKGKVRLGRSLLKIPRSVGRNIKNSAIAQDGKNLIPFRKLFMGRDEKKEAIFKNNNLNWGEKRDQLKELVESRKNQQSHQYHKGGIANRAIQGMNRFKDNINSLKQNGDE